jgi:Pyruvate/2-oxoacid:ferredoxin oxidoreductase delta subunit/flavodoxin
MRFFSTKNLGTADMKNTIYCFSATGNSLQIARLLAKAAGDCGLEPMTLVAPKGPVGGTGKSIGFVFPVFNFGLPRIVKRFVEDLEILPGTYCFAFISYGGYGANTLGMLEDLLAEKNVRLSYAGEAEMPKSNASAPGPEQIRRTLDFAAVKVAEAARDIARGVRRPIKRKAALLTKVANGWLYKNIAEWDKKFFTTNQCAACGLCAKLCPVSNIAMNTRPIWLHHCEQCLRCLQWCPHEAIQHGKQTAKWKRYRNPGVQVKELYRQTAEKSPEDN